MFTTASLYQSKTIEVNGKVVNYAEYRKKMNKANKAKRKTREKTMIQMLPETLDYILKNVKVIKQLATYYDCAQKTFGKICVNNVLKLKEIEMPFLLFRMRTRELMELSKDIQDAAKSNDKAVYQYIELFAYKLDDVKEQMERLYKGVRKSQVMDIFNDKEFINGKTKRLGLRILMYRSANALDKLDDVIKRISNIAVKGVDAFSYRTEISKWNDII